MWRHLAAAMRKNTPLSPHHMYLSDQRKCKYYVLSAVALLTCARTHPCLLTTLLCAVSSSSVDMRKNTPLSPHHMCLCDQRKCKYYVLSANTPLSPHLMYLSDQRKCEYYVLSAVALLTCARTHPCLLTTCASVTRGNVLCAISNGSADTTCPLRTILTSTPPSHHTSVLDMNRLQRKHFTRHGMHLHTRGKWQLARLIVEALGGLNASTAAAKKAEVDPDTRTAVAAAAAATVTVAVTSATSATVSVAVTATAAATITVTATANRLYTADSRAPDADYIL
ncbi:hypothetical protein J6590_072663 [Homalodisca vitripennis]|nr:hypothetical protein J6590_072663 [Homalodisca vitripennis]